MTDSFPRGSFTPIEWGHAKQNAPLTNTPEDHTGPAPGGIEEELHLKVSNLEMLICELLLKNERLRTALAEKNSAGYL